MAKKPMKQNQKSKNILQTDVGAFAKVTWRKKNVKVAIVLIILYIGTLFVPFVSPFTQYPLYWIKCGGKQPIIASDFAAGHSYRLSGDSGYRIHPFISEYFCTEEEAEVMYRRAPH